MPATKTTRKYTKKADKWKKSAKKTQNTRIVVDNTSLHGKKDDPVFKLVEGIPENQFGMSNPAYYSLKSNLKDLKVAKNSLVVPISYKIIIGKIIRRDFPEYAVKYQVNIEKNMCSIWRKA